MGQHLARTDMARSIPCTMEDCPLCITNPGEGGGAKHQRSGALYCGVCLLCAAEHEEEEHEEIEHGERRPGEKFESLYWGESGFNGYTRTKSHISCIEKWDTNNAFAKHLAQHHPNNIGDMKAFCFRVVRAFKSPLLRQIWEAVKIYENKADIVMSSKSEWHQPAVDWLVVTREI